MLDSDKKPAPDEITNEGDWQNNLKVNNWKFPNKDYFSVEINEAVHRVEQEQFSRVLVLNKSNGVNNWRKEKPDSNHKRHE